MDMRMAAVLVLSVGVSTGSGTLAQSIGETEFMNSCAQCHGADGSGNGPMASFLTTPLPDLTSLQSNNSGVFPLTSVYSMIDGSKMMGAHGTREMPAWGNRYKIYGESVANTDFATDEAEVFARFRILALTEYVASIQKN